MIKEDFAQKARQYAFLLLKFRLRSEDEIRQRLKKKKFSPEIIEGTVYFLKERKFLDDCFFARAWIGSRLKKPLGIRRLKEELRIKGVNKDIIESSIEEARDNYSEEDVVAKIVRDKWSKAKGSDPLKAKRRIYSYLLRRGFSPQVIMESLERIKV